ncbi:MAG: LysM peptidoglycan-binding domain-containing protein [Planctomycetota bacterium]
MADRIKYFLLGLLFLVVAGVIAYDRWNTEEPGDRVDEEGMAIHFPPADPPPTRIPTAVPPPLREPAAHPTVRTPPPVESRPAATTRTPPSTPPVTRVAPAPGPPVTRRIPKPEPPARVPPQRHTVRPGETLESIALRYYGTRKGVTWIASENGITNADFIRVGYRLTIPLRTRGRDGAARPARTRTRSRPSPAVPKTYVVRRGDGSLYAICRRFYGAQGEGARVHRVMEINGLWSAEVTPGTTLRLPPK